MESRRVVIFGNGKCGCDWCKKVAKAPKNDPFQGKK